MGKLDNLAQEIEALTKKTRNALGESWNKSALKNC